MHVALQRPGGQGFDHRSLLRNTPRPARITDRDRLAELLEEIGFEILAALWTPSGIAGAALAETGVPRWLAIADLVLIRHGAPPEPGLSRAVGLIGPAPTLIWLA